MLSLLLDEHIPPAVARSLRLQRPDIAVWCMAEWQHGDFLGKPDALCLQAAAAESLTLLTYDCRTIPSLLKTWAEEGQTHAGVIFVDEKTIAPGSIGAIVRAIIELFEEDGHQDWTSRVRFLRSSIQDRSSTR